MNETAVLPQSVPDMSKLIDIVRDALRHLHTANRNKRKSLKVVHFDHTPRVEAVPDTEHHVGMFRVSIAAGKKLFLAFLGSEEARQKFVQHCQKEEKFVPAVTVDPNKHEKTWQLAQRIANMFHRFIKFTKKHARRHRHTREGRKTDNFVRPAHRSASGAR